MCYVVYVRQIPIRNGCKPSCKQCWASPTSITKIPTCMAKHNILNITTAMGIPDITVLT